MPETEEDLGAINDLLRRLLALCDKMAQCVQATRKLVKDVGLYASGADKKPLQDSGAITAGVCGQFAVKSVFDDVEADKLFEN